MKPFMDENFLLGTETARNLYFNVAKDLPIVDWHCHIPPKEIEQDRRFENITQLWLEADHYKWRAMRQCGVPERQITGGASDREKFDAWVKTIERCVGNPLYHWTHLELARVFGVEGPLSAKTADAVWKKANAVVSSPGFSARGIVRRFGVKAIFTTDDPADPLDSHRKLRDDPAFETKVLPAFRPDKALNADADGFKGYVEKLGAAADVNIESFADLKEALCRRMDFFKSLGCRASDQSFTGFPFLCGSEKEADAALKKVLAGGTLTPEETERYRTALMLFLGGEYAARGWAMELHIGAMRNNNARLFAGIGPDAGCDSMADAPAAQKLSCFLDALDKNGRLPKTILFALNPADYPVLCTMAGNFAGASDGSVQPGTAWWFNDNRDGMEAQLRAYANMGVLANFVGMVTDSRSFLSYPRHEYFRRILCNLLGGWVENGEYPADFDALGRIVEGICCRNALKFFSL